VELLQQETSLEQEAQNKKRDRVNKLAQVFSRANSVLALRPINVHVVDNKDMNAPAWSGASDVYFNLNKIRDEFDAQSLLSLQGLNFHEIAHVRYTPRNGSEICRWVIDNNYWQAFNALEDMRIETLLVGRFPSITNWLTATIIDYLLREPEAQQTLFALVRGRRYLPVELRAIARENYVNQQDIPALCDVVDEYRTLLYPQDTERAKELIEKYNELLNNLPIIHNNNGDGSKQVTVRIHDPHGHAERPTNGVESSNSRPATRSEQEQDRQRSLANDKQDEKEVVKDKPQSQSQSSADETSKDVSPTQNNSPAQSPAQSQSPAQGNSDEDFDDVDDDDEFDFDDVDEIEIDLFDDEPKQSTSKQAGNQDGTTGTNQQVKDTLENLLDEIVDELSKELDRLSVQVNGSPLLDGNNSKEPQRSRYTNADVPQELFITARAFARELERLRAKHDPAWIRGVESGKLNAQRAMTSNDYETLFDEWSEGRDDVTAIEAVILLDKSGSMSGSNANNAYKSMWAIKKALEKVEARTTVLTFDHRSYLLYGANDKAGTTIRDGGADGGTNPEEALLFAQNVLAKTEKPIRLLFMITDGAWDTEKGEDSVRKMKRAGVLTCQAIIADHQISVDYLESNRHEFELLAHVPTSKEVLGLGKELVRKAIQRKLVAR
jgi:hypothetical protein